MMVGYETIVHTVKVLRDVSTQYIIPFRHDTKDGLREAFVSGTGSAGRLQKRQRHRSNRKDAAQRTRINLTETVRAARSIRGLSDCMSAPLFTVQRVIWS